MKVSDFRYELPRDLIAHEPLRERAGSRLMVVAASRDQLQHTYFGALPQLLREGDLLVFNNTRVIPARLFGCKSATGGGVEILVERIIDSRRALVQLRASKSPKAGSELSLLDDEGREALRVEVLGRRGELYELGFPPQHAPLAVLQAIGHVPLPPYIERADTPRDRERYQTVYAARDGAVAAPTAGLHFDQALLERLRARGVETAALTLHVGAGTFQPVRCANVEDHRMHAEFVEVGEELCDRVMRAHREGRRVVAVGTTSLRALESASDARAIRPLQGETSIFIYPGYRFRCVDALVTNFHLPESTLLMLVCAFSGTQRILDAYEVAVEQRYRFFSYGDAMFVEGAEVPLIKAAAEGAHD
jgi:S-adenosylmethionine:tRNA ribosyltransferase-isomerase